MAERPPGEAAVRAQLDRILASGDFDASDRNRRFLRYVVEECLAGRTAQIKAYCIAVSVFNREPSFDPQSDPIVRLEAGRLRRSLDHYYLTAGHQDPIRILVPKGGYTPRFEWRGEAADNAVPDAASKVAAPTAVAPGVVTLTTPRKGLVRGAVAGGLLAMIALLVALLATPLTTGPDVREPPLLRPSGGQMTSIVVTPFDGLGSGPEAAAMASVLTDEVVQCLTDRTDLSVHMDVPGLDQRPGGGVNLSGSLQLGPSGPRVIARLIDRSTGAVLWSDVFDQPRPGTMTAGGGTVPTPEALAARIVAPLETTKDARRTSSPFIATTGGRERTGGCGTQGPPPSRSNGESETPPPAVRLHARSGGARMAASGPWTP